MIVKDVGGGNDKDSDPHSLANISLKWMIKEIIASETGLIFRRSALERAHFNLDELLQAAERTKIEDVKHKVYPSYFSFCSSVITESSPSSPQLKVSKDIADFKSQQAAAATDPHATLRVSDVDGGVASTADGHKGGKTVSEIAEDELESENLYERWKGSSGAADAECPLTDELSRAPGWWILECIPFIDSNQDKHGHWKDTLRCVSFRFYFLPIYLSSIGTNRHSCTFV